MHGQPHIRTLLHSQVPATCPCPEPEQSSPCLPILLFEEQFLCHAPIYAKVYQVVGKEFIYKLN